MQYTHGLSTGTLEKWFWRDTMLALQQRGTDVLLPVTVQPRASRNAVAGLHGNALKLLLTAPPVEGAANAACLRLLTDLVGVSQARLSIIRGMKARQKLICIAEMSVDTLRARLRSQCPDLDL
jgi:uncharacterized protein (TIGR00251 family)